MKADVLDYELTDGSGIGVYCGTYSKYNNGSLYGMWIDLELFDDAEEFFDVCRKLHSDEEDPEFMFQDFQCFPEEFYSESMGVDEVQKILDFIKLDDDEKEMVEDYIECYGGQIEDFEDILNSAEHKSQGKYEDFSEFSDGLADEMLCHRNDVISRYFDYKAWERDLSFEYSIGSNGYVFND